ncbi:hypothetical protein L1787_04175 [Acuticoccus sp. M5D2P5]|uniref:hypothetical protein n=1 Tax=Acuticoccus kalidii TaxID=2910977 RepID=UPI001F290EE2|nr:hypothetical protein [Acuticoccus kalidii]MCF3932613.1 hypothetical protein [Acuticoccus kalidii]
MSKIILSAVVLAFCAASAGTALARGDNGGSGGGEGGNDSPSVRKIEGLPGFPERRRPLPDGDACQQQVRTGHDALILVRRCDDIRG